MLRFANYHLSRQSSSEIDAALDMWAASVLKAGGSSDDVPWHTAEDLYATIDAIQLGDCPWKMYQVRYQGPVPAQNPPKWMGETYELCARNSRTLLHQQFRTPDFKDKIHYSPYMQFNAAEHRVWTNLLSADWAWVQADKISADSPVAQGAVFIPIVAGSDKTTVSVATGHQEYHPVYMSPGNITNLARRAHGSGMLPVAFLPIPKASKRQRKKPEYTKFVRQLYHACLACIFEPLKAGMTTPELIRCPDGHLRRAFYGIGPYIADYPEQVWLAAIVQNWCPKCDAHPDFLDAPGALHRSHNKTDFLVSCFDPGILWDDYGIRSDVVPFTYNFPRANIHELLSPDLLHQAIKGTFKDHFVTWVGEYLVIEHGEARAVEILHDIDRRYVFISAVPIFPGLRRFPDGRDFSQWTGDDSKALMKVYMSAITGHVPSEMVQCLAALLDFLYIARQNSISTSDLEKLDEALARFHQYREVFIAAGVRFDISLPRQHALVHYASSIRLFGSPNGLCSSITESTHIKAVKEPWRRSSRYRALIQMLRTLSRLHKMAAARRHFAKQGMMEGSTSSYTSMILAGGAPQPQDNEAGDGEGLDTDEDLGPLTGPKVLSSIELSRTSEQGYPTSLDALAAHISQPSFPLVFRQFLWEQQNPESDIPSNTIALDDCPAFYGKIKVHHSAVARFYAPSDLCGAGGMHHERIRSTPIWQGQYPRRDTAFVETNAELPGMRGMVIARVLLFFSCKVRGENLPCALVHWLVPQGVEPDIETGLWLVKPEFEGNQRTLAVIHLDTIARGAHLLPVYGSSFLPEDFHFSQSLDVFCAFFVNSHVDHHAHEFVH
ncbi:hypothetical protein BDZ97DRAFT_1662882 [Flammula alnicola]|nr:hypothetical protein BDZ97DRAFT_1662882 [Flammula alnicola]